MCVLMDKIPCRYTSLPIGQMHAWKHALNRNKLKPGDRPNMSKKDGKVGKSLEKNENSFTSHQVKDSFMDLHSLLSLFFPYSQQLNISWQRLALTEQCRDLYLTSCSSVLFPLHSFNQQPPCSQIFQKSVLLHLHCLYIIFPSLQLKHKYHKHSATQKPHRTIPTLHYGWEGALRVLIC